MTRRIALEALAGGIEAGSIDACYPPLGRYDPLLRRVARRRIQRALRDVGLMTAVQEEPHLLRLAYLRIAGVVPNSEFDDASAVAAEQGALARDAKPPRQGPWFSASLVGGLVAAVSITAALMIVLEPFDPRETPAGGMLSETLPRYVVALSNGDGTETERTRQEALGVASDLVGEDGKARLHELLAGAEEVSAAPVAERSAAQQKLTAGSAGFNAAMVEHQLPYFVDPVVIGTSKRAVPFILSFYVERDVRLSAGDTQVRAVHLWRLDSLNLGQKDLLGYTRPSTPAAIVLLDQIESDLVRYVLPSLPEGEPMILVDRVTHSQGHSWAIELCQRAGATVRRHFEHVPAEHHRGVEAVGRLLARRRALVEKWQASVRGHGLELHVPDRLIPEHDYYEGLSHLVPRADLHEWNRIHDELLTAATYEAFVRIRKRYVTSVERHEVQHRLDYARDLIPVPEVLAVRLNVENPIGVAQGSRPARARDEMSAYLASIATAEDSPLLEMVLLARFLFNRGSLGGAYSYAALGAYEGIAQQMGVDTDEILGTGTVGRRRLTKLFYAVVGRPPHEIKKAATEFYRAAYGQQVPEVRLDSARDHTPWRH